MTGLNQVKDGMETPWPRLNSAMTILLMSLDIWLHAHSIADACTQSSLHDLW